MSKLDKVIEALARGLAIAGGIVLLGLTILTVVSIGGRALIPIGLQPIPGDFELVEAGCAAAVFASLAWCQLQRGHVTVDLFMPQLGRHGNRLMQTLSDLLIACIAITITTQLLYGALDKYNYAETTFILQFPVWWSYLASAIGAVVFSLVSVYVATPGYC